MTGGFRGAWDGFWFHPAGPVTALAARVVIAAHALWIVLSRLDLPTLARWPPELWAGVPEVLRVRYGIVPAIEPYAFILLLVALAVALVGPFARLGCFLSAVLLYHFAPFEELLTTTTGPYLHGLTLSVLGLAVLAFAREPAPDDAPSSHFRWPVALLRLLLALPYLFAGFAKLRFVGLDWASAENIQAMARVFMTFESAPPWAGAVVASAGAAGALGAFLLFVDLAFVAAALSRRAAAVLVPLAVVAHVLQLQVFGVAALSAPLLLVFVDGDAVRARIDRLRA
jgi:hypothetical protein